MGAFQLGLGLAAIACALSATGHRYVMAGIAAGTALHVVAHVVDVDNGGNPARDITSLVVLAGLAALAAAGMPGGPTRGRAEAGGP